MNSSAKKYNLSQVAQVSAGYALRSSAESLAAGDIHMIQLKNVDLENGIDWEFVPKVSVESKKEPRWLKGGDILFAARSTKNFASVLTELPQFALCSPHFFIIRPSDSLLIDPEFLAWQINRKPVQGQIKRSAVGTSVMNIRRATLERLELSIPALETQRKIVNMWKATILEKQALTKLIINRQDQIEAMAADLHHQ